MSEALTIETTKHCEYHFRMKVRNIFDDEDEEFTIALQHEPDEGKIWFEYSKYNLNIAYGVGVYYLYVETFNWPDGSMDVYRSYDCVSVGREHGDGNPSTAAQDLLSKVMNNKTLNTPLKETR